MSNKNLDQYLPQISSLYLRGFSEPEIAAMMELDIAAVRHVMKLLRQSWKTIASRGVESARAQEVAKLDNLERFYWERIGKLEEQEQYDHKLISGVARCIADRCKLMGLNAPVKIAPTDPSGKKQYVPGKGLSGLLGEISESGPEDFL